MKIFQKYLYEFWVFTYKQAYASLFGGVLLFFILGTHFWYPENISEYLTRYDFLLLVAIFTQIFLLIFKLEEWREFRVIVLFHFVGLAMEIFKLHMGAWDYPESGFFEIMGVPLFTGFMYSAVGSYIARSWKIFDFKFSHFPSLITLTIISVLIYANFFLHHFIWDYRIILFLALFYIFRKSWVYFTVQKIPRKMPSLLAAFLLSFFIWIAENLGTFANAWTYPNQELGWQLVSFQKLGSWFLLMIISFVMVAWEYFQKKTCVLAKK
jgi:uncharacterized membrane protein YoaT (DUF817 family)